MRFFSARFTPFVLLSGLLLSGVLLLAGCGIPTVSDWKQVRFTVTDVQFKGLRENQAEWRVVVAAENPTAKRLKLEGLQLVALLEADTLATLGNSNALDLTARHTTELSLDLLMPPKTWNTALRKMQAGGSSEVLIIGDAYVGTWFGTRKIKNAFRKKYQVDLATLMGAMGGDLIRNLFFK